MAQSLSRSAVQMANANDPLKHLTAGGVAGAVSRTVVSPLERIKILLQTQPRTTPLMYRGVWHAFTVIGRQEGIAGYFKGNGTNVIRIVPYSAAQFAAYEQFKKVFSFGADTSEITTLGRLSAGACAGLVSVTCTYPLDLVRTRLSINLDGRYSGIIGTTRTIVVEEGFRGLFRGLPPTLTGVAPYVGLNFTVYEELKKLIFTRGGEEPSVVQRLVCGGTAGAVAQSCTYPLDVVRRRMQTSAIAPDNMKFTGMFDCFSKTIRQEGVVGLYRGMWPNLLKVAPSVATSFVSYEYCKKLLMS